MPLIIFLSFVFHFCCGVHDIFNLQERGESLVCNGVDVALRINEIRLFQGFFNDFIKKF